MYSEQIIDYRKIKGKFIDQKIRINTKLPPIFCGSLNSFQHGFHFSKIILIVTTSLNDNK